MNYYHPILTRFSKCAPVWKEFRASKSKHPALHRPIDYLGLSGLSDLKWQKIWPEKQAAAEIQSIQPIAGKSDAKEIEIEEE